MLEALQYEFVRNALIASLLASVACGIIGTYVVVKKIVSMSGGIAHASFGGIGLGYFLGINPIIGALFFSLASAISMGLITRKTRIPEDTAIGILWAVGMSLGIVFIGLTPGYAPDLMSYLFGNILLVPSNDLLLMLILDGIIIAAVIVLYKEFLAISFDEEFSTIIGIPVGVLNILLLCIVALTIVILIRVVGMILVIALLTFPAAMARQFTYNLKRMIALAIIFSIAFTVCGLWLSFELNLASGATIILVGAAALGITFLVKGLLQRLHKPDKSPISSQ